MARKASKTNRNGLTAEELAEMIVTRFEAIDSMDVVDAFEVARDRAVAAARLDGRASDQEAVKSLIQEACEAAWDKVA